MIETKIKDVDVNGNLSVYIYLVKSRFGAQYHIIYIHDTRM